MPNFALGRTLALAFLLGIVAVLAGCGGSVASSGGSARLRIEPSQVSLSPGESRTFTAFIDAGPVRPVVWSVDGGDANGTITPAGVYTAPTQEGSYTVRARLEGTAGEASAAVAVSPAVSVRIEPRSPEPVVIPRSQLTLRATVSGSQNEQVEWQVVGPSSGATIDQSGTFVAPAAPGTFTVEARSKADPTKFAQTQVTVSPNANVRLRIEGKSDVLLQLATAEAPNTTANFVTLVNKGFYDGILFHRYEPGFVIQGGDPLTKTLPLDDPSIGTGGPGYTIPFEQTGLTHEKYALAMARSGDPNSAGSQFYITLAPQPSLDGSYAVFGKVVAGFDTVDALRRGDKILSATTELP